MMSVTVEGNIDIDNPPDNPPDTHKETNPTIPEVRAVSAYNDLPEKQKEGCCSLCDAPLEGHSSPWSICFDPSWEGNVWGGDTHEYRAVLCQECAEKLLTQDVELTIIKGVQQ